nr:MAG TPA: hypothetical protein [Caudoviricetes sp.]
MKFFFSHIISPFPLSIVYITTLKMSITFILF